MFKAVIGNRGNPFSRYARRLVPARAGHGWSDKELAAVVRKQIDDQGNYAGPVPENYIIYTDFAADIEAANVKGYNPSYMFGGMGLFLLGLFAYYKACQAYGRDEDRPYIRKQFPFNSLYLERGGDPEKIHLLKPIDDEVYDPYPYYGENSLDHKFRNR